jgi:hypothetical protein|tara:strand:+ start:1603 stop:1869 length:267 start_codon:yes stop_codon:yes gene_type:complete
MSLDDERQRGLLAETLRNNPLLKEIFQTLKDSYITDWSQTELSDVESREQSFYLLKSLNDIEGQIDSIISTGRLASQQMRNIVRNNNK